MNRNLLVSHIGKRIFLPGHFDVLVLLEDARPLGSDDSAGYECRVRLHDGSLEEAVISAEEARKYVDELQRARQERIDGLKRLETARTGPIKHIGTAFVFSPGSDTQSQLIDLADELDPNIRRQSEIAAEDKMIEALVAEGFLHDRIERVGHLKLGFDIRAHRIADEATGEVFVKRIEVKGRL